MLKGLKKTKPQLQHNSKTQRQNSYQIKDGVSKQAEQQNSIDEVHQRLKQLNTLIMEQYLTAANQLDLKANLECLRKAQNQYLVLIREQQRQQKEQTTCNKSSSKFQYSLSFEEEGTETLKSGQKRVQLRYKPSRRNDYCIYCPENEELVLISAANFVYLALPKVKSFKDYHHFILAPIDHQQTRIGIDSQVQEQLKNYQKCLIQMLQQINLHAVFLQQFSEQNSHIYIECIGIPFNKAYDLPFYFKNALETVEGNWTSHKSIIEIRKEKGGLMKQIPKQIKYFYIDFGIGYGYAHAIEHEREWDRTMVYEIMATALNLQIFAVKTTEEYSESELRNKQSGFNRIWAEFDWTKLIDNE